MNKLLKFPEWDTDLFIRLNGLHCETMDCIMSAFSSKYLWIPMYLIIIAIIIYKRRFEGIAVLCVLGFSFAASDQLSVILFKNLFERLRPCHVEELRSIIHSLENCGGKYGFISNHAANSFCLAMFTALFFRNKYYSTFIFLWAACVAYSRIYVGKHFPLDVICGAFFGMVCSMTMLSLYGLTRKLIPNLPNIVENENKCQNRVTEES